MPIRKLVPDDGFVILNEEDDFVVLNEKGEEINEQIFYERIKEYVLAVVDNLDIKIDFNDYAPPAKKHSIGSINSTNINNNSLGTLLLLRYPKPERDDNGNLKSNREQYVIDCVTNYLNSLENTNLTESMKTVEEEIIVEASILLDSISAITKTQEQIDHECADKPKEDMLIVSLTSIQDELKDTLNTHLEQLKILVKKRHTINCVHNPDCSEGNTQGRDHPKTFSRFIFSQLYKIIPEKISSTYI